MRGEGFNNVSAAMAIPMNKVQETSPEKKPLFPKNPTAQYVAVLAEELRTSEKVVKNSILKSKKWTKSCYELLSKIIREDLNQNLAPQMRMAMGTSLSAKTLQKIVSNTYRVSYPIDPRTVNTLNKLVLFLGYKNWDDFVHRKDTARTEKKEEIDVEEAVMAVVQEAVRREHFTYCGLPEVMEEHLLENYIKDSPAYNKIMDTLVNKAAKNQVISNNYNPSTYEILEIEVRKIENNYAQVHTKEYWLLCWWCASSKRYVKRYKDISDHFYILKKKKNRWMIRTNASKSDFMELV
ncbi:MAG: hypothetical protein WBM98_14745 [Maribacter sp.]|uniref:hypothetical protein n=1 Tax=Maribacter sp. TaxID=1897614 RepID=UPI003C79642B